MPLLYIKIPLSQPFFSHSLFLSFLFSLFGSLFTTVAEKTKCAVFESILIPYILAYILFYGCGIAFNVPMIIYIPLLALVVITTRLRLHLIQLYRIQTSGQIEEFCIVCFCTPCAISQSKSTPQILHIFISFLFYFQYYSILEPQSYI